MVEDWSQGAKCDKVRALIDYWRTGYDWRRWFVRLAHDPKQNFGSDDATRLALGMRF